MRTGIFYEINISQNGKHVFATDSSIRQYDHFQIIELLNLFKTKFPVEEGYYYSVSTWHVGCPVLPDDVKAAIPEPPEGKTLKAIKIE